MFTAIYSNPQNTSEKLLNQIGMQICWKKYYMKPLYNYYLNKSNAQYPNGLQDIFICKLDTIGNFIWAKSMGGVNNDAGNSITTDAFGNVYTVGMFEYSDVDFDPGSGVYNLSADPLGTTFISKLGPAGDFIWAKSIGGNLCQ